ncbi:MAG: hypothetical protein QM579_02045 [Desulfovibrio sp.]|uniref:hypothetical protein n=1 Tax=Desulfovibrio sp. TaxID=885 RepID=UPI0039E58AA7
MIHVTRGPSGLVAFDDAADLSQALPVMGHRPLLLFDIIRRAVREYNHLAFMPSGIWRSPLSP